MFKHPLKSLPDDPSQLNHLDGPHCPRVAWRQLLLQTHATAWQEYVSIRISLLHGRAYYLIRDRIHDHENKEKYTRTYTHRGKLHTSLHSMQNRNGKETEGINNNTSHNHNNMHMQKNMSVCFVFHKKRK